MSFIYAQCLGNFAVTFTAAPDDPIRFATERARALLAYLLNQPDVPQQRDYLAYLIWPDRSDRLARQNLRKTLSRLRQATHPHPHPILESDYQTVQLNTAVFHSDLAAFRYHLQADSPTLDDLVQAAAFYQGEYLHGFHFDEMPANGSGRGVCFNWSKNVYFNEQIGRGKGGLKEGVAAFGDGLGGQFGHCLGVGTVRDETAVSGKLEAVIDLLPQPVQLKKFDTTLIVVNYEKWKQMILQVQANRGG